MMRPPPRLPRPAILKRNFRALPAIGVPESGLAAIPSSASLISISAAFNFLSAFEYGSSLTTSTAHHLTIYVRLSMKYRHIMSDSLILRSPTVWALSFTLQALRLLLRRIRFRQSALTFVNVRIKRVEASAMGCGLLAARSMPPTV